MSHKKNKTETVPTLNGVRCLGVIAAASYIGCTEWFMRDTLLRGHHIPYTLMGKRYVIDVRDLDHYIDQNKRGIAA